MPRNALCMNRRCAHQCRGALIVGLLLLTARSLDAQAGSKENPLKFLEPLIGQWAPVVPDSVLQRLPHLRSLVIHLYEWTVGQNAIHVRENFPVGKPRESELDGMIYWDPTTQRVHFVAVGGHGPDKGRLFQGEYQLLADGRIERVYDVFYRTTSDTPGGELGGSRRRYREVYTITPNGMASATLDWWLNGRWTPFAMGRYEFKRMQP